MKRFVVLVLILGVSQIATGEVSTRVCLADGNTLLELADPNVPFVYREIMVGTKLTIIVSSDANDRWSGSLTIAGASMEYGVLSARDFNDTTSDWGGSRTKAAGNEARVWDLQLGGFGGFDLLTGSTGVEAGDWFVIDYTATNVGGCNVRLCEGFSLVPICNLFFFHVHTRDLDGDTEVDFADFAVMSSCWGLMECQAPSWCEGTDLDTDGDVDVDDLILFTDYWLERTE